MTTENENGNGENRWRSVIEMTSDEAKKFFLKPESYCTLNLPPYFKFEDLLTSVDGVLAGRSLSNFWAKGGPRRCDDVNHTIMVNKDGRYAWRPLEIIHPALYVSLVNNITDNAHWPEICKNFNSFTDAHKIQCISLPVESLKDTNDKAEQVTNWWESVEQKSIEMSLDFEFILQTDVVDCYAAIYTHSIAWALHTKATAKEEKGNKKLIGNIIDSHIQDMRDGQTNGIPQGSVLMDFIGEMVLGYADSELEKRIAEQQIENYRIIRYRDDYRIFVNNPQDGEAILKNLTEVMIDLGLKLGDEKTGMSSEVIRASVKNDKLSWMLRKQTDSNIQRHLMIIHDHSINYPNSGSLQRALGDYHRRLRSLENHGKSVPVMPLIAIVTDIAYRNPRTYPVATGILSNLIARIGTQSEKIAVVERIRSKFAHIPNTGYMDVWLQMFSHRYASGIKYDEPLCRLVQNITASVWNNEWISAQKLRATMTNTSIIDAGVLDSMPEEIEESEISLFPVGYH